MEVLAQTLPIHKAQNPAQGVLGNPGPTRLDQMPMAFSRLDVIAGNPGQMGNVEKAFPGRALDLREGLGV